MTRSSQTEHFHSSSPDETAQIASQVALQLRAGDLVLLSGEVGSGKTTFVAAAAAALGVEGRVTSPTFAIGNVYDANSQEVAHLDLYRLGEIDLHDSGTIEDFLTPDRVVFVEWPHDGLDATLAPRVVVELSHAGDDRREISVRWVAVDGESVDG